MKKFLLLVASMALAASMAWRPSAMDATCSFCASGPRASWGMLPSTSALAYDTSAVSSVGAGVSLHEQLRRANTLEELERRLERFRVKPPSGT